MSLGAGLEQRDKQIVEVLGPVEVVDRYGRGRKRRLRIQNPRHDISQCGGQGLCVVCQIVCTAPPLSGGGQDGQIDVETNRVGDHILLAAKVGAQIGPVHPFRQIVQTATVAGTVAVGPDEIGEPGQSRDF